MLGVVDVWMILLWIAAVLLFSFPKVSGSEGLHVDCEHTVYGSM